MRAPFDYLAQLKQNYPPEYLDSIQYELDIKVYYYGNHYLKNSERALFKSIYFNARSWLIDFYKLGKDIRSGISDGQPQAVCNAYFGLERQLNEMGIKALAMPWL